MADADPARGGDRALVAAVATALGDRPGVTRRRMFGRPCFLANGRMFALVSDDALVLTRLDTDERAALAAERPTVPYLARDREVAGWAALERLDPDELPKLERWLEASYRRALLEAQG